MPYALALAAAQLEPALLGHRHLPVGPGRLREQGGHGLDLFGARCGEALDAAGGAPWGRGVSAGHAYESRPGRARGDSIRET
ncbi:hypothetical protein GCM10010365_14000 [Streptomyces poonensis]|uniref:Uncharacterized protein n=1 Tax=Streptomyces poonensis TaxID=68255 RepID=A0A918UED2_9ACTN|nr:hypothetical protein GCM10010365_14000 [Streptomyces poonensis]GLJ88931.1 hypothetical protein GCM10017589_15310 [Streptomyces poonensis]